jgi:hypothetical protein
VIDARATTDFGKIGELSGEASSDFEHARNVAGLCQVRDLWQIALDDRIDIGAIPVLAPPFAAALDRLGIPTTYDDLQQLMPIQSTRSGRAVGFRPRYV